LLPCVNFSVASIFMAIYNTSIPSSPVALSLLSFILFPPSFLLSGAQVSTSCPQSAPSPVTQQYRQQHFFHLASVSDPLTKGSNTRGYRVPDGS
jgi:uncharacterized membrane protein YdfJ with MMPL/SSD domain